MHERVKSKITSIKEIIEVKPHIVCLNETKLKENENISIEGYHFENNNKDGQGGVSIGILNSMKHMCTVVERVSEEFETLWIKISNEDIIR